MKKIVAIFTLIILLFTVIGAEELRVNIQDDETVILFVDINNMYCDDDNPGTEEEPLYRIQEAANRSIPGTMIYVKEGIYYETVNVRNSGNVDEMITFSAFEDDCVVVHSTSYACFNMQNVEYIKINGFELTGAWNDGTAAHGGGIKGHPGVYEEGEYGVRNSIFSNNLIYDNDAGMHLVLSDNNMINNNIVFDCGEASIRLKRSSRNEIFNNLVYNNGINEAWGITFYGSPYTKVYHNTIVEREGGAVYIYEGTSNLNGATPGSEEFCIPSSNSKVYDNICIVAKNGAPLVIGSSTTTDRRPILDELYGPVDNQYHHNLWHHQEDNTVVVSWGDLCLEEPNVLLNLQDFQHEYHGYGFESMSTDPLFKDTENYNFNLKSTSPAKKSASDGTDIGVDFDKLPAKFNTRHINSNDADVNIISDISDKDYDITFSSNGIPPNEVHIYRDYYGVPHIYGGSNHAMFFGEGFAHAEDHLEQMLENYRTVQGTMAEVFGSEYLASDKQMRLLRVAHIVDEKYNELSFEAREAVEAFAQGVNYYMENNPENVPEWATPVTPQEIVAWTKLIILARPLGRLQKEILHGFGNYTIFSDEGAVYESNEWVVAPEKTADGHVMLQTDPHLLWSGMNSWYEVHLESDDYHVAGATMWGVPGVMMGHNDHVAWALTANSPDTADAYIETIKTNSLKYRYDGQWLDVEIINEIIEVAGEGPVEVKFYYTHHGPIVYYEENIAISGKMSTWDQVGAIDQFLAYNRAQNLDDFKDALSMLQCVRWNHVYGDVDGNIFYIWNARVFHRQGNYDYTRPLDGSTSNTEWGALVTLEELPQEINPESKFFQNCNTAPWYINPLTTIKEGDYPDYVVGGDFGARGIRSSALLDAKWDLTVNRMKEISLDNFCLNAEMLIPLVDYCYEHEGENVSDPEGWLPQAIDVLNAWDYNADADAKEVALARLWIEEVNRQTGGVNLLDPTQPEDLNVEEMHRYLELLIHATETMYSTYDSLTIPWGEIHVFQRGDKILPLSGAGHVFNSLHMSHGPISDDGIMYCDSGSSYMMLVQLSNPVRAWSQFPLSESDDPESSHYSDISELYSRQEYKPAWFTEQEVMANLDPVDPNPTIIIIPEENNPPLRPNIKGPSNGKAGSKYEYTFTTIDSDGDDIFYYMEWGDGNNDGNTWIGPYSSGEQVKINHTWSETGNYNIKAKAKDIHDSESNWGTLYISMLKNKQLFFMLIWELSEWFPLLKQILILIT
ncbi:hypothetical protein B6U98_02560 [Thermoplasmatales archaeon ex4572_165]|nr:MAG: hypothetical protein B6U98_02560 [Thermoplasmatales archaeon ex4572_165]